jgi:phosphate transport system substrate-binding protein
MSMATSADRRSRLLRPASIVAAVIASAVLGGATQLWGMTPAGASPSLQSTGSSFASVAIQQWVGQASTLYGLNINWQVTSSVLGLNNFTANQVDFAASDIPYSSGQAQGNPTVPYQYMPDVAGGLAFMYNLNGNDGQRITSLILNAHVIDQIFLGEITKWNDPAVGKLNPQLAGDLPGTRILPVYRSDASGENYLLSDFMLHEDGANFNAAQNAFQSGLPGQPNAGWPIPTQNASPSPQTYPNWVPQANPVGQSGSDNAANYVSAVSSVGAITYVETAYAKEHSFPVASLINASGNAVQPTSLNVATALVKAVLHTDLTQDLTGVYTNPVPNAYPLSAYSYLVTQCSPALAAAHQSTCAGGPPGAPSTFPNAKGQALGQFVAFLACAGQEQMAVLGYSPLPPNLVQEDFDAVGRLNGGQRPPPPTAANCKNPYVDGEIPVPGVPVIQGQGGGGVVSITVTGGGVGGATGGGAGGTSGSSGGAGGSSGSGGNGGSGSGRSGAAGTGGSGSASGGTGFSGGGAATLGANEPNKYQRADALLAATRAIGGPQSSEFIGWTLLVVALLAAPPLIALFRRRPHAGVDTEPSTSSQEMAQ